MPLKNVSNGEVLTESYLVVYKLNLKEKLISNKISTIFKVKLFLSHCTFTECFSHGSKPMFSFPKQSFIVLL